MTIIGMFILMAIPFELQFKACFLKLSNFGSAIAHLPFLNIDSFFRILGMLPSDAFMSNLYSQLGCSTREFQAL